MEKEMIRYGTYFTWKDNQGNINTECNRACDLEGYALTLPTFSLTKVAIPCKEGEFVLKEDIKCKQVATLQGGKWDKMHDIAKRVYGTNGISPALHTCGGGNLEPTGFRVRKLTEKECFRLQGVKDEDFAKIRKNQSKSSCYHLAGDSITSSVLMALFGEMLNIDWKEKVNKLVGEIVDV